MYPQVRMHLPELEEDVFESYEEHHVADVLVMELMALQPGDERLEALTTVLIEKVTQHIEEEEQDSFPKVRAGVGLSKLQELGQELLAAKKNAPPAPRPAECTEEGRRRRPLVSRQPVVDPQPSHCRPRR